VQVGVVDLQQTGAHIVRRLLAAGDQCVVYDTSCRLVAELAAEKAYGAASVADLAHELDSPRAIVLAGPTVDQTIRELLRSIEPGDVIVDCFGPYSETMRRARDLASASISYVEAGISGALAFLDRPCCITVGGDVSTVRYLEPLFRHLAGGDGYLHCGPAGAGHFVSAVHDRIEAAMVAALTSGFSSLCAADPGGMEYPLDRRAIAEVWRHGSAVASHLLDLTAGALAKDVDKEEFSARLVAALEEECGLEPQHITR
jgi:6-phosphogluconate dehydrogenase